MHHYVEAIDRKLEIALYHLAVLRELLPFAVADDNNLPPISLQAHFEACGRALVAMLDQLASGLAAESPMMPPLHLANPKRVRKALEESVDPAAKELNELITTLDLDPRINDLSRHP